MCLIYRGKKWAILIFHTLYSLNTHWPRFHSWKHSVRPLSLSGFPLVFIKFNSQQPFCNSVSIHWSVSLLSSTWVYFGLTSCVWGIPSFPFFSPPFLQWACGFLGPLPRQGAGERRLNWCSTTSSPRNKDPESLCLLIPEMERLLWWQTRHGTQRGEVTHAAALLRSALAWRAGHGVSGSVFSAGIRYQFLNKNETAGSTLMTRSRKYWPPAHQQNRVCVLRVNNGPVLGKLVSVSQRVLNRERVCHCTET